ncbi:hypothetical protein H0H87_010870, partial [Tephrocybe sp. NHM501043]
MADTIQDDMESFVLVIIYHALRYFPHNKKQLTRYIIKEVFNRHLVLPNGLHEGGQGRGSLFLNMYYIEPDFEMDCKPLNKWIHAAILAVREWITGQTATSGPPTKRLGTNYKPQVPPERELDLLTHAVLRQNFTMCLGFLDWLPDKPVDAIEELERGEKEGQKVGRALPDAYKR